MSDYHAMALNDALKKLAASPILGATIRRLADNAAVMAAELNRAVSTEVPQFSASMNPDILPESARHSAQHIEEILRLLRGGPLSDFDFVQEHARRRAEQRFPLEATLHAYRSGHKVLSRWLRESAAAAAEAADFAMNYTDAISTTFASSYSAHTLLLADIAGDQREELLRLLLDGHDEADLRVARILRDAGFPNKRQYFCVALARSVNPAEMQSAARARRLAESIEKIMSESAIHRLIDVYANKVTMVFADVRRESGWTAPRSSLAARISETLALVGNAVLIGVSNNVPSTAHIPTAYKEATAALELAQVTERVVQFGAIPLHRLLLYFAGENFRRVLPSWTDEFHAADERANGTLRETLRAYSAADMNLLQAAQVLGVHPNTVYARFQRISDISGLQARSFNDLTTLLIVAGSKRLTP
jgi:hypothetical protein